MKIALIGDIHANLQALEAVIDDISKQNVSGIFCLGDIVGYGANPNECISLIKSNIEICVAGNHDYAAIGKTDIANFNEFARSAILWTEEKLGVSEKSFLSLLPLEKKIKGVLLVHGTPRAPAEWQYMLLMKTKGLREQFTGFSENICFVGHSHVPGIYIKKGTLDTFDKFYPENKSIFELIDGERYIVDIGSIGQPRDRDNRSCYVIFDSSENTISFRRIDYDITSAAKSILNSGMNNTAAEKLASRLFEGL